MAAMAYSLSVSTASLQSSVFGGSLRRDLELKRWSKNSSRSACVDRGRCVARIAVPELVEVMHSGIGPEAHQLYHVLVSAVLGVPLPVDENALAYWAVALPAALLYSTATPGPIAGVADFVQGHISANSSPYYFSCAC